VVAIAVYAKKLCGVNIEVHHIDPEGQDGTDDIDNALPLCFECHSAVQHYNDLHPRGSKYKPEELRATRDQIYEEFTRHLVPPIHYEMTQALGEGRRRKYPDVGFLVQNLGNALAVKLRVNIEVIGDDQSLGSPAGPHYSGTCLWNLNPQSLIQGHFDIPRTAKTPSKVEVVVKLTIVDMYEREHHNLPVAWVYMPEQNDWYFEPSPSI
jgi:HNH endonuclease